MKQPPRLKLAHLPTPIHKLPRLSAEIGKDIYLWRDDLTGFVESGNKVRKLEFLLADALQQNATRIITAGGSQSNHTRATAFCARRLGLDISLVVRESKTGRNPNAIPEGNLLLNHIAGAEMHFISYAEYQAGGGVYRPFIERVAEQSRQCGEKPYVIMEGGSQPLGCWGYLAAVSEMLATWKTSGAQADQPTATVFADGSGGTHAGLHLGCETNGIPTDRLWAINVCDSAAYFQERVGGLIDATAREFNLPARPDGRDRLQILDGHFGVGFAIASDDDWKFYINLARQEGVLLDPTYTGKAFRGMLEEIKRNPDRFGNEILFLHSGGTFATFAASEQLTALLRRTAAVP